MPGQHSLPRSILFVLAGCLLSLNSTAAVIEVTSLGDTGNDNAKCELRSALLAANTNASAQGCSAGSGADTIRFEVNGVINLTSSLPTISESVEILGPGQSLLTVSGAGLYRPFWFSDGSGNHSLKAITLEMGAATFGACIVNQADSLLLEDMLIQQCVSNSTGGAISSTGSIRVLRSLLLENSAAGSGGAIYFAVGGSHQITDSSFVQNAVVGDGNRNGGAIYINAGDLTITRSTFNQNSAVVSGGAIYANAPLDITHSTIVGNTANSNSVGNGYGGGIYFAGEHTLTIGNSIVSGNLNLDPIIRPDIAVGPGYTLVSTGYNLIGVNAIASTEFPEGSPNVNNDYVGTTDNPLVAGLNAIGDFGGPTPTMPPLAGSLPVDHGNCPVQIADQRGISNDETNLRVIDNPPANAADGCDIGAVELAIYLPEELFTDGFEELQP